MSVPGLNIGYVKNPKPRMPAGGPPANAHETQYTSHPKKSPITHHRKVRTRGRVMGTPGKIPADVYAQVIKSKQRARMSAAQTMRQV